MKRLLAAAAVFLVLALLAVAFQVARIRAGPSFDEGERRVAGVSAPVEILRDSLGIPHVFGATDADVLFGQGWVHARDRLWQMELFRRIVRGRLSEMFGEAALDSDRFLRTLGMHRAAARAAAKLDPETRGLLEAYAAGVNAALEGWRGPRPPEMALLRVRPEPWTVEDVLGIEKVMAWDLSAYATTLALARAFEELGPERFDEVRPHYPEWGVTIVDGDAPGGAAPRPGSAAHAPLPDGVGGLPPGLLAAAEPPALAAALLGGASMVRASNAWVVGGERSRSGKPLLANDMHLALRQPSIWHLVGLHGPGVEAVGMGIAGSPGVVAGHTGGVAWGFTNAYVDDADLFVERLEPGDPARYRTPGGSAPFVVHDEAIRVRGRDEPVSFQVRETRHGPVVTPVVPWAGDRVMALRWIAHDPSRTPAAILAMNRARDADDLLAATRDFTDPHQNVVYADTAGRWGYRMAGRVPLRRSGRPPFLPVPGWTGDHDWTGDLAPDRHPAAAEPAAGLVVTANNRQGRGAVSELVTGSGWAGPWRAQRITELLGVEPLHDAGTLHAVQLDVGSAFVDRYRGRAVAAFREADLPDVADALASWDGRMTLESTEATAFQAWAAALRSSLRRGLYGRDGGYYPRDALARSLDEGRVSDSLAAAAARAAWDAAGGAPWGDVHVMELEHPLAGVPLVAGVLGFDRGRTARAGGPESPNVAGFSGDAPPFVVRFGPSQRHVVDMADVDGAGGFVLPGGQSGVPASSHAFDQLEAWREGGLFPIPLERAAVERRTRWRLRLVPAAGERRSR